MASALAVGEDWLVAFAQALYSVASLMVMLPQLAGVAA